MHIQGHVKSALNSPTSRLVFSHLIRHCVSVYVVHSSEILKSFEVVLNTTGSILINIFLIEITNHSQRSLDLHHSINESKDNLDDILFHWTHTK